MKRLKLKVLYDNESEGELRSDWGFSALIEGGETVLFDTGADVDILQSNMDRFGISAPDIDKVVLSHEHHDHTGGLFSILDASMSVYVPRSFSRRFKKKVKKEAELVEVSGKQKISEGVLTTGELGDAIKEQSLMLKGKDGYILLTGCAHPGLGHIMDRASKRVDLKAVMGGFHGFSDLDRLEDLSFIIPCHCTKYKDEIKSRYPDKTRGCFAGLELEE